jgi:hypothetical protein
VDNYDAVGFAELICLGVRDHVDFVSQTSGADAEFPAESLNAAKARRIIRRQMDYPHALNLPAKPEDKTLSDFSE